MSATPQPSHHDWDQRFRSAFANAAVGIAYVDTTGRFLHVNSRFAEICGYSEPELRSLDILAITHPDDRERNDLFIRKTLSEQLPNYIIQKRYVRKDGTIRWVQNSVAPWTSPDGCLTGMIALAEDVTERRLAEDAAFHARDLAESANRAKDRFLAVLSHELRTPLSPIAVAIAMMEQHPQLPPELREDVAMIRRNIALETKLIDDLLDLSRVTTGKLRLQMQTASVHTILTHAMENCAGDIAKGITVHSDLSAAFDAVTADPARLQQLFWNLLRNAAKFTPAGGHIFIRTAHDPLRRRVIIEVRDTGVGIASDALPRIFDAFDQGSSNIAREFGGLGLGLAIAKAVAEAHGGAVHAASEGLNQGATFTVELPTAENPITQVPVPSIPAATSIPHVNAKILLVEDHPDTARTLAKVLGMLHYDVKIANTVAAALELASSEHFDLVLSDIGLPDATGYELMEKLREHHGLRGIALSGYGMDEDMRKSRNSGFSHHLVKPVNLDHLSATINRVLRTE